ncbi:hypothetical protein ACFCX4_08425 [Kitasatospora sp. NPDC056327]|uniref:hypothetical protein n=1 Tax=Kitasatospora sp. NPDC056327 TaxID=3345785 RepID=UPI0035DE98C4
MNTTGADRCLDQIVFRWQGNEGRRSTGITAAAWSCSQDRADELARELAPLLRVDRAVRPSLVSTVTQRGEAAVIQRWPTKDPGGRPSTACHLLLGDPRILNPWRVLSLHAWRFSDPQFAEDTTGECDRVAYSVLQDAAEQVWNTPWNRATEDTDALAVATASLLRRPHARLSLRTDSLSDWTAARSVTVIRGLYKIFGPDWLPQPWTFATYDVTDRHDLMITWVSDWATDSGPEHPRSRLDPRRPDADRAHDLGTRLVDHWLDLHPQETAGLPLLTGSGLRDAANLPAEERLRRLARALGAAPRPRPQPPAYTPPPDPAPPMPPPDPGPAPGPTPPMPPPDPGPVDDPDDPPLYLDHPPAPPRLHDLRRELVRPGPNDAALHYLVDMSEGIADEPLLDILREENLPDTATKRLLLLFRERLHRLPQDSDEVHRFCAEVLHQRLFLFRSEDTPPGRPAALDDQTVRRAAWLFGWAVLPHTRDVRHEPALHRLFASLLSDDSPGEHALLRRLLPPPGPDRPVPDLPPGVWQLLLHRLPAGALADRYPDPAPAPQPPPPPPPPPPRTHHHPRPEQEPTPAQVPPPPAAPPVQAPPPAAVDRSGYRPGHQPDQTAPAAPAARQPDRPPGQYPPRETDQQPRIVAVIVVLAVVLLVAGALLVMNLK